MFIYSFSFKTFEETTEDQNNSEMIEGKNLKSLEKPKEFKERCVSKFFPSPCFHPEKHLNIHTKVATKHKLLL